MNTKYTQTGTPVQYLAYDMVNDNYILYPAVINSVCGGRVDILVFTPEPKVIVFVKHVDFFKHGESFWQNIPEAHPPKCAKREQSLQLNKSK